MAPGALLYSLLTQSAAVTALVDGRVFPLRIEQDTPRPAITYQLISRVPDGTAACELDDIARVQLSLFADTYAEVEALASACRPVLHRLTTQGVYLELSNEIDHHDDGADCYFRTQDYRLEIPAA